MLTEQIIRAIRFGRRHSPAPMRRVYSLTKYLTRGLRTLIPERPFEPRARAAFDHLSILAANCPLELGFELTTLCNSHCTFCAHSKLKRPKGVLSMDLFLRVCHEYADMGGRMIALSAVASEPLVDPHYLDRLRLVEQNFPTFRPHTFTNAIGLSRYSDDDLRLMLRHLSHLDISIGGLTAPGYMLMFGVDRFDLVWAQLERLAQLRREHGGCPINIHIRTTNTDEVRKHPRLAVLRDMGFQCNDISASFSDWGGLVQSSDLPPGAQVHTWDNRSVTRPCLMPMYYPMVLPDGRVSACACFATDDSLIMGDLGKQSLSQIWTGVNFRRFRQTFRNGILERLCRTCSSYRPYTDVFSQPQFKDFKLGDNLWEFLQNRGSSDKR
jgi:radical SAM protein with 4Fe4S-binding SPASM domain